jgi:para-aminobenzoate N-oxygenase AurF
VAGAAGITRIFPDLSDDLLLNLFHKGAQTQWTSRTLDWSTPVRLSERQRLALARLLTPIYFGEQTAMAGASSILPSVMAAGETTAQLYLASFIMDEARHFETLTRLYQTLGHDPLGIRDMPELLRYYHRLRQGDRVDWVWGILISDIIGKHFYRELGPKQVQPDPFFGGLTTRILKDESRHLAFAEHYLKRNLPKLTPERRRVMVEMRDDLLRLLESMTQRVREDALAFDVAVEDWVSSIGEEIEGVAKRVGLVERHGSGPSRGAGVAIARGASLASSHPDSLPVGEGDNFVARCFGCLLSLICAQRLATT